MTAPVVTVRSRRGARTCSEPSGDADRARASFPERFRGRQREDPYVDLSDGMPLAMGVVTPFEGPLEPAEPSEEVVMCQNVLIRFGVVVVEVVGIDGF